jgi:hypothetical protein
MEHRGQYYSFREEWVIEVLMTGDFGRGHRDECPDLLYPPTLNKAAKCSSGVMDRLLFEVVATWVRGDMGRLDL